MTGFVWVWLSVLWIQIWWLEPTAKTMKSQITSILWHILNLEALFKGYDLTHGQEKVPVEVESGRHLAWCFVTHTRKSSYSKEWVFGTVHFASSRDFEWVMINRNQINICAGGLTWGYQARECGFKLWKFCC